MRHHRRTRHFGIRATSSGSRSSQRADRAPYSANTVAARAAGAIVRCVAQHRVAAAGRLARCPPVCGLQHSAPAQSSGPSHAKKASVQAPAVVQSPFAGRSGVQQPAPAAQLAPPLHGTPSPPASPSNAPESSPAALESLGSPLLVSNPIRPQATVVASNMIAPHAMSLRYRAAAAVTQRSDACSRLPDAGRWGGR
jgi:hypothetical protein